MNRRTLLAAGSAALLPASMVSAIGTPETPVQRLYREWRVAYDHANEDGIDDEEVTRRVGLCDEVEARLDAAPSQTMQDLALKVRVACGPGSYAPMPEGNPGLCAEIEALAGVVA